MTIAIEPMITAGGPEVYIHDDEWSISTTDGSLAAHFEHTVAVTAEGPRILTAAGGGGAYVSGDPRVEQYASCSSRRASTSSRAGRCWCTGTPLARPLLEELMPRDRTARRLRARAR